MSTYVISDLHGQYGIFLNLLEKISFSDADTLYMLGDAIDRGPDGIKILRHVMNAPNMELLLGNHELLMLTSVDLDGAAPVAYRKLPGHNANLWLLRNGGNKTYYRYKLLRKNERLELLDWLSTRPLLKKITVNGTTYLLTHSYFDLSKLDVPYDEMDYKTAWNIVWRSPYRTDLYVDTAEYAALLPWKVVLGHVPIYHANPSGKSLEPFFDGNIIDIDGCCARHDRSNSAIRGGILLRLDDLKYFTCSFEEIVK